MRLLSIAGTRPAPERTPLAPQQRAVSPGSSWEVEVWLDDASHEARAHVIALALDRRAVHRIASWDDLLRVATAHGVLPQDVIWNREAHHWCLEHWGLPADASGF